MAEDEKNAATAADFCIQLIYFLCMRDRLTKARRSWNMSRIRGKDTNPEKVVRSLLHRMGFRFRLHGKKLPGRPDIVLLKLKTVIFVHGCFWHRHRGCKNCTTPTNRREWWLAKLNGNAARDKLHQRNLRKAGWARHTNMGVRDRKEKKLGASEPKVYETAVLISAAALAS